MVLTTRFFCPGPSCSETHVPGYINSEKAKNYGKIFVVSVNDAFVMKAWGKDLDAENKSGVRIPFRHISSMSSMPIREEHGRGHSILCWPLSFARADPPLILL